MSAALFLWIASQARSLTSAALTRSRFANGGKVTWGCRTGWCSSVYFGAEMDRAKRDRVEHTLAGGGRSARRSTGCKKDAQSQISTLFTNSESADRESGLTGYHLRGSIGCGRSAGRSWCHATLSCGGTPCDLPSWEKLRGCIGGMACECESSAWCAGRAGVRCESLDEAWPYIAIMRIRDRSHEEYTTNKHSLPSRNLVETSLEAPEAGPPFLASRERTVRPATTSTPRQRRDSTREAKRFGS